MIKKLIYILVGILFSCHMSAAADLSVRAAVEKTEVSVGEPFIFQIQVSGSEDPEEPDTSVIKDFNVVFQGGQRNSSSSITIVNGQVTKEVREGYYFSYQLTPMHSGRLAIPSIKVKAGGSSAETNPIWITVNEPAETEDFKLRLSLSGTSCYVGEPVILTVIWYIGKDVRDFSFTLPVLSNDSFRFDDVEASGQQAGDVYRIPIGSGEVAGVKGRGTLDGKEFTTITFQKVLIPVKSGNITIEPAVVSCSALTGYQRQRNRFNDGFFDDFFSSARTGIYETVVVPSNSPVLRIMDLPENGRPADFAGHIGRYTISADAVPVEVSVGDPITLTLRLTGPEYLANVDMPALEKQPALTRDFKMPSERASGEISGRSKVFTQTIRPLRPDVKEIPAIELPYFDTETRTYRIAKTEPIPLVVRETRVITAMDAEGNDDYVKAGSEIESLDQGIAFNYEDTSVIEDTAAGEVYTFRSPLIKGLVLSPPFIYLLLLSGVYFYRNRNSDSGKVRSRKAYSRLSSSMKAVRHSASMRDSCAMVLDAMRNYLGDKLNMPGKALTFNDVKGRLSDGGLDQKTISDLDILFRQCEEGRYAGAMEHGDAAPLVEKAFKLTKEIERDWRRA
ncbi:MAG: protein BatD [Deltaproteobacteria bacterium]|nr:protein BatD [Deltaproteobacteria bacterium]